MFDRKNLDLITRCVGIAAALLTALTFLVSGFDRGTGAIAGGAFSTLNWLAMRWLGRRLVLANPRGRALIGILLSVKMLVAMGVVALILASGLVDPLGFVAGFSALPAGIVAGVVLGIGAPRGRGATGSNGADAGEEG
jgi:uncharacterized membrane protein YbhN (UPF0104 family)